MALYLAHYLLTRYGQDPDVTRLIDTRTVYIVPRADPDGAEVALTGRVDWDPASAPGARDADGDGRLGEDGPEDINGDGRILRMRRAGATSRDTGRCSPSRAATIVLTCRRRCCGGSMRTPATRGWVARASSPGSPSRTRRSGRSKSAASHRTG